MRQEWDAAGKRKKVKASALTIANALWGQTGLRFHPAFAKAMTDEYGAPLYRIDFGDQPAARKAINDWVEKETRDKIKEYGEKLEKFVTGSDLLLYDTFFTPEQYAANPHWGHSTPDEGIRLARVGGGPRCYNFHHNPEAWDDFLQELKAKGDGTR